MPWTVKDVDRFKKGLTPTQKKKWVSIANSVLKDCQSKGGKNCEAKAIKIANSKFSEEFKMSPKKIPNGALRLVQVGDGCHAFAEGEDGQKKLKMTVYSGKVIKNHFWWGNLAIDLSGGQFPMNKYPVLENHNTDRRVAFTGKPVIDENGMHLDPDKTKFLDNEVSNTFQKDSSEGFPFQASMYARPSSVERINEGEKADVNGFSLKGPATIWRKWEFKEASVCVFGWDSQTQSSAFSKDQMTEVEFEEIGGDRFTHESGFDKLAEDNKKEVNEMPKTVKELREKYPELTAQLAEEVTNDLTQKFNNEKDELKNKNDQLSQTVEQQGKDIRSLQKDNLLSKERSMKKDADNIVTFKLSASDIPDRLHEKIRKLLDHNAFVKDDKLDIEAFSQAVDDEIQLFEDAGVTSTVIGAGSGTRKDDTEDPTKLAEKKLDEEDDDAVDKMLSMVGEAPETK